MMFEGGDNFVSSPPAFSNDAKKLLVCTGNTVTVFSVSTGMKVTELEGHKSCVTSVVVSAVSHSLSLCWTSSLDGTIRYWEFSFPELMKTIDIRFPIHSMVIPKSSCSEINKYAFVSIEDTSKPDNQPKALRGQVRMFNLSKSCLVGGTLAETRKPESIVIGKSGTFFGIPNKRKLHVWRIPAKDFRFDEIKKIKLHHTKILSTLAFHPSQRIIAGGDVTGRILIWRGFGGRKFLPNKQHADVQDMEIDEVTPGVRGNDDADSCSTWHWHSTEVKFLSFSSDGAYLYSGGKEGVLVVWQLDTMEKKFLPRLGSPILYFRDSPDPSLSSISCADNRILLLKMPSLEIQRSISGIKLPFSCPEMYKDLYTGFAFDQSAAFVALRTMNYRIQFYSLFENREVSQVQVCERNYHPVDDIMVFVTIVSLSIDGSIMGTVEVRLPEDGIGGLVTLKFWVSESRSGEYTLSTTIYEPHGHASISAIAFHPQCSAAATTSYGGDFKVWSFIHGDDQRNEKTQKSGWKCQSIGSYGKRPMTAAAFSGDGSCLAVAAETVITLWNPKTNALVAVVGATFSPIIKLSFIGMSEHLVSVSRGSEPQLSVWSISKLSRFWAYKLIAEDVASSCDNSHFAVLALLPRSLREKAPEMSAFKGKDGLILLFNAEDPIPIATWHVDKAEGGGLAFLQWNHSSHEMEKGASTVLVYINGDHKYVIFDPYSKDGHRKRKYAQENSIHEEKGKYGYASVYGELPEYDVNRNQIPAAPTLRSDGSWDWEAIFSGPARPSLSSLCKPFLESLLKRRSDAQQ